MDGPARAQAALARIESQCEAVSQAMFRVNLPLRNMAKNLTDEEVARLMVDKNDGPVVYIRRFKEHRRVEKRARHDIRRLKAQRVLIELGLKDFIFNDAHLAPYQLKTDVSQGPLPVDTEDSALRGVHHHAGAGSVAVPKKKKKKVSFAMPVAHDEPEDADGASSNDNAAAVGSGQQFDEEDGQCDHVENDEADEEEQEKAEDEAGEAEEDVARLSDFDEDGDMIEYGAASGQEGQGYGMDVKEDEAAEDDGLAAFGAGFQQEAEEDEVALEVDTANLSKAEQEQLAAGGSIEREVRQDDGKLATKTLRWI